MLRSSVTHAPEGDAHEYSALLSAIYDAALDPAVWPEAIRKSCSFLACGAGALGSIDMLHLDSNVVMAWGFEPTYLAALSDAAKTNGLLRQSLRYRIGDVVSMADAVNPEEYYQSESYRSWAKPQGIVDAMQVMLDRSATSSIVIAFSRFQRHGPVDETARHRLKLLAPHFRRAFLIGKTIDLKRIEAENFAKTIDALTAGVFLVDETMHLIHANASGRALLAPGFLGVRNGALRAADRKIDRALAQTVEAAAHAEAALPSRRTPITLTRAEGARFTAYVLPLGAGARWKAAAKFSAAAAIFIRSAKVNFPEPVATVSALHGLTPGETRVLFVILEIQGVAAASTMLGISEATVKTHLRSIYRKTGTSSQTDLVKLVAGHASPLA